MSKDIDRLFFIAEMSGNHGKSLEQALKIVKAARNAGADAVKVQSFTPDSMTMNLKRKEFIVENKESPWYGKSLYDLYAESAMPFSWHKEIFDYAKQLGIKAFSSPFSKEAVDMLEELETPIYKVASFEIVDLNLIKYIASTGKPMIISTGMATISEIESAVDTARTNGCNNITLLKCTSTYPTKPKYTNLRTIPHLAQAFQTKVGLSDHTLGCAVPIAAVGLGAMVIEKHITMSRKEKTIDFFFSLEPEEFQYMVESCRMAQEALGDVHYGPTEPEKNSIHRRRSLYFKTDLDQGEVIKEKHIAAIRPGLGISPKHRSIIMGLKLTKKVKKGEPVDWNVFK